MGKIFKIISYILFFSGIFLGTFGQIIWAIIFWNNDSMFINHWTVALFGLICVSLGVWGPARDLTKFLLDLND